MHFLSVVLLGALWPMPEAKAAAAGAPPAVEIGQQEQLFLDDHVIGTMAGVVRRVNQVDKKAEPVIRPTARWELGKNVLFGSAIRDPANGLFKMWYYAAGHMAYATSKDGLVWEKPKLGLAPFESYGAKTNVVIWRTPGGQVRNSPVPLPEGVFGKFYENYGVIFDPGDPDPARRYKTAFVSIDYRYQGEEKHANRIQYPKSELRGMGTAVSADGIHWKLENDYASLEFFDIGHLIHDHAHSRYVAYGRTNVTADSNKDGRWVKWGSGRAVSRIESADFRVWSAGKVVLAADQQDPPETEIYSMAVYPHQGIYIGMVQMYYRIPGRLEIQLAVSRDGQHFKRIEPRHPFIPEGNNGAWDQFNISLGDGPPIIVGDEMWFYYGGRNHRHSGHRMEPHVGPQTMNIGLATIKRDRFVALTAKTAGEVVTKSLSLQGSQLFINANVSRGSIRITLLDSEGKPRHGYGTTIRGQDAVSIPVAFDKLDLRLLNGKPTKIRFELSDAELFGFRMTP